MKPEEYKILEQIVDEHDTFIRDHCYCDTHKMKVDISCESCRKMIPIREKLQCEFKQNIDNYQNSRINTPQITEVK